MSSRFLIPALCVGSIALACGPRAHNEASAPRKNTKSEVQLASSAVSQSPIKQQGASRAEGRVEKPTVVAQLYIRADSNVRFALHVSNVSKKRVELTFLGGQTYEFVVLDSLGRERWRWGSGRMFTQTLRNKLLSGGESVDFEETWKDAALPPGRYTARAMLSSSNYPIAEQTEFVIQGTTVASR